MFLFNYSKFQRNKKRSKSFPKRRDPPARSRTEDSQGRSRLGDSNLARSSPKQTHANPNKRQYIPNFHSQPPRSYLDGHKPPLRPFNGQHKYPYSNKQYNTYPPHNILGKTTPRYKTHDMNKTNTSLAQHTKPTPILSDAPTQKPVSTYTSTLQHHQSAIEKKIHNNFPYSQQPNPPTTFQSLLTSKKNILRNPTIDNATNNYQQHRKQQQKTHTMTYQHSKRCIGHLS